MKDLHKILFLCVSATGLLIRADEVGTVKISTRYIDANTGQLNVTDSQIITLPTLSNLKIDEIYVSDPGMNKTLCVLGLKLAMEDAVTAYHANKSNSEKIASALVTKVETLFAQYKALGIEDKRLEEAFELARKLAKNIKTVCSPENNVNQDSVWVFTRSGTVWSQQVTTNQPVEDTQALDNSDAPYHIEHWKQISSPEELWFVTTLQESTLTGSGAVPQPAVYTDITQYNYAPAPSSGSSVALSADGNTLAEGGYNTAGSNGAVWDSLNLTAGGAKDFNHLENLIKAGQVPVAENFEGFLSEFHLPLSNQGTCEKLICVNPAVAIDAAQKKMFVQVGMNSSTTAADFKRKPLNLSLVIDISGSMIAPDGTEKSRLEWAKDAALLTLDELTEQDIVSIVIFESDAFVLVEPSFYAQGNKKELADKVRELQTHGGTNLEAGLRRGYELVARNLKPDYENRVILISDAGLNTGTTDDASLLGLVSDYALEKIGLTAIGIGENFNHAFINKIATTNGGNYIFAQSGKQLARSFANFKYLVSPVAYNIAADIDIRGIETVLAKAYGIPFKKGEELKELVNIRTLFFSTTEAGGGAMILEYDLPEMVIKTPISNNQETANKDSMAQQIEVFPCFDPETLPHEGVESDDQKVWVFV